MVGQQQRIALVCVWQGGCNPQAQLPKHQASHKSGDILTMKKFLVLLLLGCSPLIAQNTKVTSLLVRPLPDVPSKVVQILTVEYPPGGHGRVHRHNADAFVYVLEGSIVMAVNGERPVTLKAGQTFYEGPNDVHTTGGNASTTQPAKFVVFLLKKKDAPVLIPVY